MHPTKTVTSVYICQNDKKLFQTVWKRGRVFQQQSIIFSSASDKTNLLYLKNFCSNKGV